MLPPGGGANELRFARPKTIGVRDSVCVSNVVELPKRPKGSLDNCQHPAPLDHPGPRTVSTTDMSTDKRTPERPDCELPLPSEEASAWRLRGFDGLVGRSPSDAPGPPCTPLGAAPGAFGGSLKNFPRPLPLPFLAGGAIAPTPGGAFGAASSGAKGAGGQCIGEP